MFGESKLLSNEGSAGHQLSCLKVFQLPIVVSKGVLAGDKLVWSVRVGHYLTCSGCCGRPRVVWVGHVCTCRYFVMDNHIPDRHDPHVFTLDIHTPLTPAFLL